MQSTGLATIDHAVQTTNEWLNELMDILDWSDKNRAFRVLRITLHTIRDWLQTDESAQLAAQLPILIRGLYYEGWRPAATPVENRSRDDFLATIDQAFQPDHLDQTVEACRAVFILLNNHVSMGEISHVRHALRHRIRDLWPDPAEPQAA